MSLPEPRPVTVHAPWLFLLASAPLMAILSAGMLYLVWEAVTSGGLVRALDGDAWTADNVIGWTIVLVLLVVCLGAVFLLLTFWQRLTTRSATSCLGGRVRHTTLEQASAVAFEQGWGPALTRYGPRLFIKADGDRVVARFSPRENGWEQVVSNLREWVRARPELIRDKMTREFFADVESW